MNTCVGNRCSLAVASGLVVSMMVSIVLSLFPRDVLDEILDLIGSVSEGCPTYLLIELVSEGCPIYS